MRNASLIACLAAAMLTSGCASWTMPAGATDAAYCRAWGESLPSRSRADTPATQAGIQAAYRDFLSACPEHGYLIPGAAR